MAIIAGGVFAAFLIGRLVRVVLLRLKVIKGGSSTVNGAINDLILTYLITLGVIMLVARWQARLFIPGFVVMVIYDIARLKIAARGQFAADDPRQSGAPDDPYTILGVHRNDSLEKIRQVYRKLQATYHPDKHAADSSEASIKQKTEKIKQINAAFQWILKNHGT
ncbi:MAG: DnaJ domain-containing protein [Nitrospirae bacterium]|nr:DnaJ domain-containing protein [Nitrospirota bacterium]